MFTAMKASHSLAHSLSSPGFQHLRRGVILTALVALLAAWTLSAADRSLPSAMTGQFKGSAKIIVNWTKQKQLPVEVVIADDGSVTGKIGDATLEDGRLKRNRGAIGRKLNIKTDYIIVGQLSGPVIKAESIERKSVSIPLNFNDGQYAGGLHTSGSKIGGESRMKLSASGLTLKPVSNP